MTLDAKDVITIGGIAATFLISVVTLAYTFWSSRKSAFVGTVTTSRIRWIESLRDKISAFIAVNELLVTPLPPSASRDVSDLIRQRDTLRHQIILHLNPNDVVDLRIKELVNQVQASIDERMTYTRELAGLLAQLRDATGDCLHKDWNRVKREAKYGEHA